VSDFTVAQRRARLGVRHRLATASRSSDPAAIVDSVVALHATDAASVYLSAVARMPVADIRAMEDAQYRTGQLVRMLGMRRTMFVVTAATAPVIQAAASDAVAQQLRRRYGRLLVAAGVADDGEAWLARACDAALAALVRLGEATGAELGRATPLLQTRISLSEGKRWAAEVNVTGWVTTVLAAEGRVTRGRPLGSWTGNQYRWRPAGAATQPGPGRMPPGAARAELAHRWLEAFGPATHEDLRWWTGWTVGETRAAVAAIDAVAVDLDGEPGICLASDLEVIGEPAPWVALLPALDPTPMGWTRRDWYLGGHRPALFDRSGNIGPTVWVDGRVVGGWAQGGDGGVRYRLLEDVGQQAEVAVAAEAERLREAIGGTRVTPRFRTPLERGLAGG
jgi:hypothetical protein